MPIPGRLLKDLLLKQFKSMKQQQSGPFLYHVNTVQTAITFLKNNGLLSRGAVEDLGLIQTAQRSDDTDKALGIYYDIFFDSCDVHYECNNICFYGPVSFRYGIDLLNDLDAEKKIIEVTKSNPIYWKQIDRDNQYFNEGDIQLQGTGFTLGNFKQHITIVNHHAPLSFTRLESVILDEPDNSKKHQELFKKAKDYLAKLINDLNKSNSTNVEFIIRTQEQCRQDCRCKENYRKMSDESFCKFFSFEE